jgi:CRISPR type I-E-associated protein CasB/Cse2
LVQHLVTLLVTQDRGPLAELRRAARDPYGDVRVYQVVGGVLPYDTLGPDSEPHRLVACLFAVYVQPFVGREGRDPRPSPAPLERRGAGGRTWTSFGASLRLLCDALGEVGPKSLDQRVTALLDGRFEDAPDRLLRLVRRLRSAEIPIDFDRLLGDLIAWQKERTRGRRGAASVRQRWAEDYWQPPPPPDA